MITIIIHLKSFNLNTKLFIKIVNLKRNLINNIIYINRLRFID